MSQGQGGSFAPGHLHIPSQLGYQLKNNQMKIIGLIQVSIPVDWRQFRFELPTKGFEWLLAQLTTWTS